MCPQWFKKFLETQALDQRQRRQENEELKQHIAVFVQQNNEMQKKLAQVQQRTEELEILSPSNARAERHNRDSTIDNVSTRTEIICWGSSTWSYEHRTCHCPIYSPKGGGVLLHN